MTHEMHVAIRLKRAGLDKINSKDELFDWFADNQSLCFDPLLWKTKIEPWLHELVAEGYIVSADKLGLVEMNAAYCYVFNTKEDIENYKNGIRNEGFAYTRTNVKPDRSALAKL